MKKNKFLLIAVFALFLVFTLAACVEDPVVVVPSQEILALARGKVTVANEATEQFSLPTTLKVELDAVSHDVTLAWTSDHAAIAIAGGTATVTRPAHGQPDALARLTATLTFGEFTDQIKFAVTVPAMPVDNAALLNAAVAKVSTGLSSDVVSQDFTLPAEVVVLFEGEGFVVNLAWVSNADAIAVSGLKATVLKPEVGKDAAAVTLTATLSIGDANKTKAFNVSVPAKVKVAPSVEGELYHWMRGALGANVTADVNLNGADSTSLAVHLGGAMLEKDVDFELDAGVLTIFGQSLDEILVEDGEYYFTVLTEFGSTGFFVGVVADPRGTSIPTQTAEGINMSGVTAYKPDAVIEGAPDLFITEIVATTPAQLYDYIEVYNNTNAVYNLKDHRIVYAIADSAAKQKSRATNGTLQESYGMNAAYIYHDVQIPAFSSAIIWLYTEYPFGVDGTTRVASVKEESLVYNGKNSLITMDNFKKFHNLTETDVVAYATTTYMLVNGTYGYNPETGLGAAVMKGGSYWRLSTKMADRMVQIQKLDMESYFAVDAVEGAWEYGVSLTKPAFFRYEWGILNTVEEVFVDGVLDNSKIQLTGNPGAGDPLVPSNTWRESINAFYARKVYYDADKNLLGYGLVMGPAGIDSYNVNKTVYNQMYLDAVIPVASAYMYPNIEEGAPVSWGKNIGLEYAVPLASTDPLVATLSRFIPRMDKAEYKTILAGTDFNIQVLLDAITDTIPEVAVNAEIIIPVNVAYPLEYLADSFNTVGRTAAYNFQKPTPAE